MTAAVARKAEKNDKAQILDVAILGTGFAGLCAAVKLRQQGMHNFKLFERESDIGGTWRDNSYPGSGCDVPSHLYCFSFAPNYDWSRRFSGQAEIHAYIKHVADKFQLRPHIQFNAEIIEAHFDEPSNLWVIRFANQSIVKARTFISGAGQLNRPILPMIDGINDFKGPSFHSARWRHDVDLTGKRVAVIGNGASAVQFIPVVAEQAAHLTVFQRSANWVIPRNDAHYSDRAKWIFRFIPFAWRLYRWQFYLRLEKNALAFVRRGGLFGKLFERVARQNLEASITDPDLRKKLTPDYLPGCKRILISDDFYPALARSNVSVETQGISAIEPTGVRTNDGVLHEVDVIIYATGFDSLNFIAPVEIKGVAGADLRKVWSDGAAAYMGMMVPGFPNFFILYGPNTNLGHNSIIFMIEAQVRYVMDCIRYLRDRRLSVIDVSVEAHDAYNTKLQSDLSKTVWDADCGSWYKTKSGRITNNWSGFTLAYWWATRHPKYEDFLTR
jgi:cation diffusion facilitator CzcD-associated flavoprotein CzcO